MKSWTETRIFPFCPGVTWKLLNGRYILPKINANAWSEIVRNKTAVVCAFSGLIESLFSFSILELLNQTYPSMPLYWAGDPKYRCLLEMNSLGRFYPDITQATLDRFPLPVFLDKKNRVYFNCLNNYLTIRSYCKTYTKRDRRLLYKQIFEKTSLPVWSPEYLPKIRTIPATIPNNLKPNSPYVLIIPERTVFTAHKTVGLNWNPQETRALGGMLKSHGIKTIVATDTPYLYNDGNLITIPTKLDYIFFLLLKAKAILSKDMDFLLAANLMGSGKIISQRITGISNLEKGNRFLNYRSDIYMSKELTPKEAYKEIIL